MALAFVKSRPFVISVLIGATTMAQLRTNIASHELKLSKDVMGEIEALHKRYTIPCP
jgi:aryl-alcohol dehydrogenase-like predicted oxidoreductase